MRVRAEGDEAMEGPGLVIVSCWVNRLAGGVIRGIMRHCAGQPLTPTLSPEYRGEGAIARSVLARAVIARSVIALGVIGGAGDVISGKEWRCDNLLSGRKVLSREN